MTSPTPPGPPADGPLIEPGRRLTPSPGRDRRWRVATVLIGSAVVLLLVLGLAAASVATWAASRGFTEIPATTTLGTPTSLTLTTSHGTVRVRQSADVDEVTLALVEPGSASLPAPEEQVRARIARGGDEAVPTLAVRQPQRFTGFGLPWLGGPRDLLLLIPAGHELSLDVQAQHGDVIAEGRFTALRARTDVGSLQLGPVTAPNGLTARAGVGDIDLELGAPAPRTLDVVADVGDVTVLLPAEATGRVSIAADVGDVEVTAPGSVRWEVHAQSETGHVQVAPGFRATDGDGDATLTVTSDVGDVTVTR